MRLFLGEVKNEQNIIKKLQKVEFPKQQIMIKGLGSFGKPIRLFYAKLESNPFKQIHLQLQEYFGHTKSFKPHITLMRVKRVLDYDYDKMMLKYHEMILGKTEMKISLIKSELTPQGAKYSVIKIF